LHAPDKPAGPLYRGISLRYRNLLGISENWFAVIEKDFFEMRHFTQPAE